MAQILHGSYNFHFTTKILTIMRITFKNLIGILLFSLPFIAIQAQEEEAPPTLYHVVDYMKVEAGHYENYRAVEKAWKKIHQANIKAGKYLFWELTGVLSPSGDNVEYNYITRVVCSGEAQLAAFYETEYMPTNWKSLLTAEEIEVVNGTNASRTRVKSEVWASIDAIYGKEVNKAKIQVVNFFARPAGKTRADHIEMENDIWKPVHQARVDDGVLQGWLMAGKVLPFGNEVKYKEATIDLYTNLTEYMTPWFEQYFKKVHPGKDIDQLEEKTVAAATLAKGEIRMVLDNSEE